MPFKITGLDHVVLRVKNPQAMLHFYCRILGCTLERELDDLGLIQLRAGASLIDLVPTDKPLGQKGGGEPLPNHANMDHLCLRIEPFDEQALLHHLRGHGIEVEAAAVRYGADGFGPSIYVPDPEGNIVELKGPPSSPAQGNHPA